MYEKLLYTNCPLSRDPLSFSESSLKTALVRIKEDSILSAHENLDLENEDPKRKKTILKNAQGNEVSK